MTDHGRHEMPATRSARVFGVLAALLCLLLGVAIATQVRQTDSGDALRNARPADLLTLLDSLQQREAVLNTEVADLQRNLTAMQATGITILVELVAALIVATAWVGALVAVHT